MNYNYRVKSEGTFVDDPTPDGYSKRSREVDRMLFDDVANYRTHIKRDNFGAASRSRMARLNPWHFSDMIGPKKDENEDSKGSKRDDSIYKNNFLGVRG